MDQAQEYQPGPPQVHEVAQDWLEAVLRRYYSRTEPCWYVAISQYTTSGGTLRRNNTTSDIVFVGLRAIVNRKRVRHQFVLKLLPLDPIARAYITRSKFDMREIKFYSEIVEDMNTFQRREICDPRFLIKLPLARCYFTRHMASRRPDSRIITSPTEESVVILENLKYKRFSNMSYTRGLEVRHMESAFEAISRIHAITLAMKVKTGRRLSDRYDYLFPPEQAIESYHSLVQRGLPQVIAFLRTRRKTRTLIQQMLNLEPYFRDLLEFLLEPEGELSLLTHTDFWANNLMFKGSQCVILDWQMISYGPPTNDLALLLLSSMRSTVRRQHTRRLLNFYYTHLELNMEKFGLQLEQIGYTKARLMEDYRRSQMLCFFIFVGSVDLVLGNPDTEGRMIGFLRDLQRDNLLSVDAFSSEQPGELSPPDA